MNLIEPSHSFIFNKIAEDRDPGVAAAAGSVGSGDVHAQLYL